MTAKWDITWRDGFVDGFSTAETDEDVAYHVEYILEKNYPIEIKITLR